MYVAVKGGERAIENAHQYLAEERRGDVTARELSIAQIKSQMTLAVDRVMAEGSLYDQDLAALAIKQARGDLIEAIFLLRAFRTTLSRFAMTQPIDTGSMQVKRRISATYKDLPGGQVLGPTFDYTHRLLDFSLLDETKIEPLPGDEGCELPENMPRVTSILNRDDMIEQEHPDAEDDAVSDITREPLDFPTDRASRLQNLARGDEGFLLAMGYSTQRGYGNNHPFAGEIRMGEVEVEIIPEDLGFPIIIGEIAVTECELINQFKGSSVKPPQFTRGYGLAFGHSERKVMAMALVDRALRAKELGETVVGPAQDEEFIMYHSDNVESSGFVQHLKLPHYVDFQGELEMVRNLRAEHSGKEQEVRKTGGV